VSIHHLNDAYATGHFIDPTVSNHADGWNITSRNAAGGFKTREALSQRDGARKKWGAHQENWDGGVEDRIFAYEIANWGGGGVPGGPDDSAEVIFDVKPLDHDPDWMDWTGNYNINGHSSANGGKGSQPGTHNQYDGKIVKDYLRTFFY
jgi:hypothetical protein